jgi:alpha-galactosidase
MPDSVRVRDLWARKDLGTFHGSYAATVPGHGAVMLKVK